MSDSIQHKIAYLLSSSNLKLSLAESFTCGNISYLLGKIPGSSSYLQGSIIAYQNQAKINLLSVKEKDIHCYSAVSLEVAKQMSENCLRKFDSDFSIATTGYAGPSGGGIDAPVGKVFISVSSKIETSVKELMFKGDRESIIQNASKEALHLLYKKLEG